MELFSWVSAEPGSPWVGTFDTGLIHWPTENIQVNAGVNIGLTRSADDWNPFASFAWRF